MGEAKRRGSTAERAKQARQRREIPVANLIQELGLPPDSKYMGYVIHNPDQDDYSLISGLNTAPPAVVG
ncbi:hypothetical protein [Pseudogulbenkiania sp. MAI-1]|uniref:hypothetical protein n=1 Tax=Pseudogulbenkiania sp. MAI-1 TaxID=990370 RepID=UPI00045E8ADB|nr:hypothetical protein [Pseudogulbenkiania sp. MAI-1]